MKMQFGCLASLALMLMSGCSGSPTSGNIPAASNADSIVLISVTSDANENPQSVDMAMKLAGFSLDEGRHVAIFFNVHGVKIPRNEFPDDFAFQEDTPIKAQLADLIERGADVHVCPICMKAHGVEAADLVEGAKVTTRPSLFAKIGANTAVFTY